MPCLIMVPHILALFTTSLTQTGDVGVFLCVCVRERMCVCACMCVCGGE